MPAPAIAKAKPEPVKSAAYGHVCVDCAKAKVKCYPRPAGGSCVRCHRRGQECATATPARRLGAKKAAATATGAARTSRLEGKLNHLVDLIRSQQAANGASGPDASPPLAGPSLYQQPSPYLPPTYPRPEYDTQTPSQHASSSAPEAAAASPYETDLTFMSPQQAEHCLQTFRSGYLKYLPYVHLPPGTSVQQLRRDRPFLWLCIQGVCTQPPSKQLVVAEYIRQVLAKLCIVDGERSVDLLLGTLTYLTWVQLYNRGRPQMTMMSHIARALIHDLKINKDLADEALISSVYSKFVEHLRPPPSHEVRRALLSCYITSSATTSFSRIAPLQWSLSMEDAAQQLREHPETSNDEILVAIASARRIIDETTLLSKLHAEDPVGFGNFTAHIPALKAALESAKKKLSPDLRDNRLLASYFDHAEASIYELVLLQPSSVAQTTSTSTNTSTASALSDDYSCTSVTLPTHLRHTQQVQSNVGSSNHVATSEPRVADNNSTTNSLLITARVNTRRIGYLTSCLEATKRCLDNLLSLDTEDFLYMTFSVIVQILYSLQTLNRLALVDGVPGWERSEVREAADGLEYTSLMEAKLRQAGLMLKDEYVRHTTPATAASGDHTGSATSGRGHPCGQEENSFIKGAELLKKTADAWAMVLNAQQQSSAKHGDHRLKVDFQVANFATIGNRTRTSNNNNSNDGSGVREGGTTQPADSNRADVSSIDGVLNPPNAEYHAAVPESMAAPQQQPQQPIQMNNTGTGSIPMYNNPYVATTTGMMPGIGGGFGGDMADPAMYSSMPDFSWMPDMLSYWEF